jgi:hypothetical protein
MQVNYSSRNRVAALPYGLPSHEMVLLHPNCILAHPTQARMSARLVAAPIGMQPASKSD